MKRVIIVLSLIILIASCGSDKTTDPFVPIDPADLAGTWDGSYVLTRDAGTDSARTYEIEIQIIFADSSFEYSGGEDTGPCGTVGDGIYKVSGKTLEFEDQVFRPAICDLSNTIFGQFNYDYKVNSRSPAELHMSKRFGEYFWQVDVVKVPEIIHH